MYRVLKISRSTYYYKPVNMKIPENETGNLLNREFKSKNPLEILVSDLTYVRVTANGTTFVFL